MNIEKFIKNKKIKLTDARISILEKLFAAHRPLSYNDIKEHISMDKATFYRNIIKFQEEGLVSSFESNDKNRYFEITKSPHPHFICTSCNIIECVQEPVVFDLDGYQIEDIILKGKCESCVNVK
ncbi:MAG: transcriptional repressor [Sulfurovum sp.]|nr:transcriptional repressor [Sulfurovum sp.]